MNQRDKNKDERLGRIGDFYTDQKTSLADVPAIDAVCGEINSIHKEIGLNMKVLEGGTKSKVVSKDESQASLIQTGLVVAGALYGYAAGKNNSGRKLTQNINELFY